jgi:hypothetical protein
VFEFEEPAMLGEHLLLVRSQIRRFVGERVLPHG